MRQPVFLLSVLLVLWIAGASYWYVCKIRCDCKEAVAPTVELPGTGDAAWKALSETSPNYLNAILHEDGGEHFRIHNPESWPHQALLLHEGRWDEFRELLEKLEG